MAALNSQGMAMLARRFTIVCLITMVFGMALSSLVARSEASGSHGRFEAACRLNAIRC